MTTHNESEQRNYHLFLPLILITLGLLILISNLGNGEMDLWGVILRIWPLLFVYGGLEGVIRRKNIGVNSFWILFGLALLLSNFGRITWSAWEILFTFWPVLIISVGIDLLFNQKNSWQQLIAGLLVVSIMGMLALLFDAGRIAPAIDVLKISQTRDGATEGVIKIEPTLSFLKLYSHGSSDNLVEGTIKLWSGENSEMSYEIKNNRGFYEIKSSGIVLLYEPGVRNRSDWKIGVSSRIPVNVTIDQIVGEQNLDLTGLDITELDSELVVGKTKIILPSEVSFQGVIKLILGEINIDVPAGVSLRVNGKPVVGGIRAPDSYQKHSGYVVTKNFEEAEYKIVLDIDQIIGQVIIHQR